MVGSGDTDGSQKAKFLRLMGARKGKGGDAGLFGGNSKTAAMPAGNASAGSASAANSGNIAGVPAYTALGGDGTLDGAAASATASALPNEVQAPPTSSALEAGGSSSNLLDSLERQHTASIQRQYGGYGSGRRAGLGAGY